MNIFTVKEANYLSYDSIVYFLNSFNDQSEIDLLEINDNLKSILKRKFSLEVFQGKNGEIFSTEIFFEEDLKTFIFVGMGSKDELKSEDFRNAIHKMIGKIESEKLKNPMIILDFVDLTDDMIRIIPEVSITSEYIFDKYKEKKKTHFIDTLTIKTDLSSIVEEGIVLGNTTNLAKELVNEPANVMTPKELSKRAKNASKEYGFEIEVYDEKYIQDKNMAAFWQVAKASKNSPRLIVMKYFNNPDSPDDIVSLVGKGLTFDTGGYSLKPGTSMLTMKSDMGGSAAVIGAISAIAKMNLKVNVYGVVAACENMISGKGYRPGDIISSMAGKTIYIGSTDAEGRLTLADAITYSIEELKASKIIDVATLTGAQIVALGSNVTGVLASDDQMYKVLEESSKITDELVWRMPTFDVYKKLLEHEEADLKNTTKEAGMIGAGLFLKEFTKGLPWIHLDIAGPSYIETPSDYQSFGGTGVMAKTLYFFIKKLV